MAIATIGSGSGGIREYLESGRKKGREYDRDLIDERIPLIGDIDLMDDTIKSIETLQKGDSKYLHISLSFAEKFTNSNNPEPGEINLDLMQKALSQYKEDLMAAYEPDEYVFYAEAHIPKVTHDIHAQTGELIERLPHIHIVIPLRNIATDNYMNPLGYGEMNIPFHHAIQEKINNDFGFKSPDDSKRINKDESILDRHVEKPAPTNVKELKEVFNKAAENGQFKTINDVLKMANEYGETRIRKGKDGDYVNLKPSWSARGINLKEYTPEKLNEINQSLDKHVFANKENKKIEYENKVKEWKEKKSLEVRYVSSKTRREYYKGLDEEQKKEWLTEKVNQSKIEINKTLYKVENERINKRTTDPKVNRNQPSFRELDRTEHDNHYTLRTNSNDVRERGREPHKNLSNDTRPDSTFTERNQRNQRTYIGEHNDQKNINKPSIGKVGKRPPANRIYRVSNMSQLGMVVIEEQPEVLLSGNVPVHVGEQQTSNIAGLRRTGNRGGRINATELSKSIQQIGANQAKYLSLLTQSKSYLEKIKENKNHINPRNISSSRIKSVLESDVLRFSKNQKNLERQKTVIQSFKPIQQSKSLDQKIKNDSSPALVLKVAHEKYGINPEDYSIGTGKDGTPRIFHENKQFNLGDFFTKHLEKTWEEARPILINCYNETLADGLPEPDKKLWTSFNDWRSQSLKDRTEKRKMLSEKLRDETLKIRKEYQTQKAKAYLVRGKKGINY